MKLFAGDDEHKDKCHVGSALFLGSSIKFMCAAQVGKKSQTMFHEITCGLHTDLGPGGYWYEGLGNSPYKWAKTPNGATIEDDRQIGQ